MTLRLDAAAADFESRFAQMLGARRGAPSDVRAAVADIIAAVRAEGDSALLRFTERFDRVKLTAKALRVTDKEIAAGAAAVPKETRDALAFAAQRIEAYHKKQIPADADFTDEAGVRLGWRWRPVDAAGLYVPGGSAAYPSTVLMNAIPARIAGVPRIVMTVPAPDGKLAPLVLAAAELAGIGEIYRVGGAQAIAALAYGTASIAPVALIAGPGNAYVAEAKRQVFGAAGIDSIAGPSEILVIAESGGNPDWIAADLLSQAEHDEASQAILITDDATLAEDCAAAVERLLASLPRAKIARASWERHGAIILVPQLADAVPLANRIAAEHVELLCADADALGACITNAGAIFLGPHTPEAIGDYVAGSNHVLPTQRGARFSSGLSVLSFMKRTSIVGASPAGFAALAPHAVKLAEAEGLDAHAAALRVRLNSQKRT